MLIDANDTVSVSLSLSAIWSHSAQWVRETEMPPSVSTPHVHWRPLPRCSPAPDKHVNVSLSGAMWILHFRNYCNSDSMCNTRWKNPLVQQAKLRENCQLSSLLMWKPKTTWKVNGSWTNASSSPKKTELDQPHLARLLLEIANFLCWWRLRNELINDMKH